MKAAYSYLVYVRVEMLLPDSYAVTFLKNSDFDFALAAKEDLGLEAWYRCASTGNLSL